MLEENAKIRWNEAATKQRLVKTVNRLTAVNRQKFLNDLIQGLLAVSKFKVYVVEYHNTPLYYVQELAYPP
jgi:hypothetical protein